MAAKRPPGRRTVPGERQRVLELGQLVVDRDPQGLKGPASGMTAGERGMDRNRRLDHLDELVRGGRPPGGAGARPIARAIWLA